MASWLPNAPYDQERERSRLFLVHGQPTVTREEQEMLGEADRILKAIDVARNELVYAVAVDDPEACVAACRRFLSIGLLLSEHANVAVASRRGNL